jgi:hypothetical protein
MVVNKVCHTPIVITLAIVLFVSKTFISHHLFIKDGKVLQSFQR